MRSVTLVSEPPGNERLRALVLDVVEHRNPQPAHLEDVPEAFRRHERRSRAEALEHRVRRDRRGVDDAGDLVARDAALGQQGNGTVDDSAGVVVWRRQHLGRAHGAVVAEEHDVGEGAADVDAKAVRPAGAHCDGSTLPGLRIPFGSKLALIACISGIRSPCSCTR